MTRLPRWLAFALLGFLGTLAATVLLCAALLGLTILTTGGAAAHEWYDPSCCNDRDCAPIPYDAVEQMEWGYKVTLGYGDHPLIRPGQKPVVMSFPWDVVRQSRDVGHHACVVNWPSMERPFVRCLYVGGAM